MINMRPVVRFPQILAAVLLVWLATPTAFAGHRKLSPELNDKLNNASLEANRQTQAKDSSLVDVIIQFKPGTKLPDGISKVTSAGGHHKTHLDIINGGVFRVPASLLPALAEDPDVTYISPDRPTIKLGQLDFVMDA